MTERNKKLMILVALITVVGVSIGFAAFSSSLLIKSSLSVDPSSNEFSVVFSSSEKDLATDDVTVSTSHTAVKATSAVIDNSGTYPTISNLGGTFTEPGQSITYTFYSMNTGKYDAYLTSIVFQNLTSGVFKECKATDGTNSDLVTLACSDISVKVQVGSEEATTTATGIEDHQLLKGASETVTITLSYESNGALADEPFEVKFGNIYLTYGTVETDEMPNLPTPRDTICVATNSSNSGSTALGTEYQCDVDPNVTEDYTFYVLSTEGSNVNLLMSENLASDVDYFSEQNYDCTDTYCDKEIYDEIYTQVSYNYSTPYAVTQVASLTSGWRNISGTARLPKYGEIADNVCTKRVEKTEEVYEEIDFLPSDYYYGQCASWAIGSYWVGNDEMPPYAWAMNSVYDTLDCYEITFGRGDFGIRPVITVSTSDLS